MRILVVAIALCFAGCAPVQRRPAPGAICGGSSPSDSGVECMGGEAVPYGEGMTPPQKLSGPDPRLTQDAIAHHVEGTMLLKCRITVEGCVTACRILASVPYMDDAVVTALQQRRYRPATLRGKPVEVDYVFRLVLRQF